MQNRLPLFLLAVTTLQGCVSTPLPPAEPNPRVVERDLSMRKSVVPLPVKPRRVVDGTLAAVPLASVPAIAPASVKSVEPKPAEVKGASVVKLAEVKGAVAVKPAVAAPPPPPRMPVQQWEVRVSDVRLAATFERWAKQSADAGMPYKILWDAEKHVLIDATPVYGGSFLEAIEQALKTPAIRRSAYPLEACLYDNNPPVVRITKLGEQAKDCPDIR